MIVTSCPLRISLVGGSTDHPKFIEKYGMGSVISFASTLRTYITIHQDTFGMNKIEHKYSINYSKKESVKYVDDIQNELIRCCFKYLGVKEINCSMTSDIYSVGSGLAASSSYLLSLIKSIYVMRKESITEFEVCKIAEKIEREFNPLVGQQDFYGSMGGLKRIKFYKDEDPEIRFLNNKLFDILDCYLIYTGILRNSTKVLETIDIDKSLPLLDDVVDLEKSIKDCDSNSFNSIINKSWENKKRTSSHICENEVLVNLDEKLKNDKNILSHKLCGAGNGGYFLIFTQKNLKEILEQDYQNIIRIGISEIGLNFINFKNEYTEL